MDLQMDANAKAARERAIADAIGQRLRDIYNVSEPMPHRLVMLLNQLSNTVVTARRPGRKLAGQKG